MRFLFLLMMGMGLVSCQPDPAPEPPNILFIMADDHSSQAFGIYDLRLDSFAQTHHIQRLAREGMVLDNAFCTNAICVPSRASILTGQYSHKNGVYTLHEGLDPARDQVAKSLQAGGYQTALVGKWHLKKEPTGFDYYHVLPGQGRYHNPKLKEKGIPWDQHQNGGKEHEGFSTDVITSEALKWLRARNQQKPFFLMCHFKAVHEPFDFAPRFADLYAKEELPLPPSLFEDRSHRSSGSRDKGIFMQDLMGRYLNRPHVYPKPVLDTTGMTEEEKIIATCQKLNKDYLRGVAGLNENIGRLLEYLDEQGLAENTVVIYTSDQGYFLGEHGYMDKRWMLEESARMPFVIRYPREIQAGSRNQDLILNIDFAPTFLDYAGLAVPDYMQGNSFRANLAGSSPNDWRQSFYYRYWMQERRPAHFGIRTQDHKLIFFYGQELGKVPGSEASPTGWELFDMQKDPFETQNVIDQPEYADEVIRLKKELLHLREEYGDLDQDDLIMQPILEAAFEGIGD